MSETASGFVRIATLLMVTAVFAVVWRGDQQTQQQFIIARKVAAERAEILAHRSAHREAAEQLQAEMPAPTPAATPHVATPPAVAAARSRIVRVEVEMELPAGIAAGTYQVVDQAGLIQKVRIPAAENGASQQDLYVLDQQDGSRRYFIRITDGLDRQPTQTAAGQSVSHR